MHKRKHGRVRAQGIASHLRVGASFSPGCSVENLSLGGAFVRTHDVLPVGTAVAVDLVRPGLKKALRLAGRVASSISFEAAKTMRAVPGMGIQFDQYPPEVEERLVELLKALAPGDAVLGGDPPGEEPSPAPQVAVPAEARLMVQVKGLLMELGDTQSRCSELERENERLLTELERLRSEVARARSR